MPRRVLRLCVLPQAWADLEKKYAPVDLVTGLRCGATCAYSSHAPAPAPVTTSPLRSLSLTLSLLFSNERCRRGLFPALRTLRCNHWLPSAQFLRLIRGIHDEGRARLNPLSDLDHDDNDSDHDDDDAWRGTQRGGTGAGIDTRSGGHGGDGGGGLPLRLEICPGMEDPCTASFLLTCWDASLLPLRCPEPYSLAR